MTLKTGIEEYIGQIIFRVLLISRTCTIENVSRAKIYFFVHNVDKKTRLI